MSDFLVLFDPKRGGYRVGVYAPDDTWLDAPLIPEFAYSPYDDGNACYPSQFARSYHAFLRHGIIDPDYAGLMTGLPRPSDQG